MSLLMFCDPVFYFFVEWFKQADDRKEWSHTEYYTQFDYALLTTQSGVGDQMVISMSEWLHFYAA